MSDVKVIVLKNGPLKVEGSIVLACEGETTDKAGPTFFCRCGASAKKPYCDGTHGKIGFKDDAPDA